MRSLTRNLLIVFLGILVTVGCTKPRSKVEGQFTDPNVVGKSINLYEDQSFTLVTGEVRYEVSRSSADHFVNESSGNNFVDHPVVKYSIEYPKGMPDLLGEDVRFRGIPNGHKYEIRTTIVHDKLWVNKIGSEKEIPTDELTLATQLADGRYMVPLVTYPISFFRRELIKNADNEDTNVYGYRPLKPQDRSQATHIQIDEMGGSLAEVLTKTDALKVEYFEGEWFYATTVVQAQNDSGVKMYQGTTRGGVDSNLQPATRVKFVRTGSSLQIVNVNVDERLLKKEAGKDTELEFDQVMSIPAELYDYRQVINDKGIPLAEEEEYEDRKIQERQWIKLDLEKASTLTDIYTQQFAALFGGSRKLTDLRIADDFWSFTILAKDSGAKVRYSFYKVNKALNKSYVARNFIVDDRDYFGLFATQKSFIKNYEQYTKKDIEKFYFVQRFDPTNKHIEFHMSHGMAQSKLSIELAEEALRYWNKAFQLAGTGIKISLNREKTVDLGDLRYNVLNVIDRVASGDLNGGGLLFGIGPSISDPKTGQIVSVSNTLHVDSFRTIAVGQVRNYILNEIGALKRVKEEVVQNFNVPVVNPDASTSYLMTPQMAFNSLMWDPKTKKMKALEVPVNSAFSPRGIEYEKVEFDVEKMDPMAKYHLEKASGTPIRSTQQYIDAYKKYGEMLVTSGLLLSQRSEFDSFLSQTSRNSFHKIGTICPEVTSYAATLPKGSLGSSDEANPLVINCANKMIKELALSTLVHELGHNFGLAHNFASSNDPENFWKPEEVKDIYGLDLKARHLNEDSLKTASIMEYMPSSRDEMIVPGKYDIAAIRYSYTGQVLDSNSGLPKKIPNLRMSLEENFGRDLKGIQTFRYCGDYQANIKLDPLCIRHDFGTTPDEIIRNFIADYYESLIYGSYRYGRESLSSGLTKSLRRLERTLAPLRRFYDEWRFHLADYMADGNLYLNQVDSEKLYQHMEAMKNSKRFEDIFEKWFPARKLVMQFFMDVATLPNHYCVGLTSKGQIRPLELDELIDQVKRYDAGEVVVNCEDNIIKNIMKKNYDSEYILELGFSPEDRWYSLRAKDENQPLDYAGVRMDRVFVQMMMGLRAPMSDAHFNRGFFPNMLDEPDFRLQVGQQLASRVMNGSDLGKAIVSRLQQVISKNESNFKKMTIKDMLESDQLADKEKRLLEAVIAQLKESQVGAPEGTQPELRFDKYKRESTIILYQYKDFVSAQAVPDDQYETSVRMTPFSAYRTGDPSYLQQEGLTKARLPTGSYITAFPELNYVSAYLIETFSDVSRKLELVHLSDEDIENAKKILEQIKPIFLASEKEGFKVAQLANMFENKDLGLIAVVNNPEVPNGVKQVLQILFGTEFGLYSGQLAKPLNGIRNAINEAKNDDDKQALMKQLNELLDQDLKKPFADNQIALPTLENFKTKLSSFAIEISSIKEKKDEFEAQRDLLLQILTN